MYATFPPDRWEVRRIISMMLSCTVAAPSLLTPRPLPRARCARSPARATVRERAYPPPRTSKAPLGSLGDQHLLDVPNGPGGVQPLRTHGYAVHDAPAAEDAEGIIERFKALRR